jgi:hypothetical protein
VIPILGFGFWIGDFWIGDFDWLIKRLRSFYSVFWPGEALILVDRQEFRCPLRASLASKTL